MLKNKLSYNVSGGIYSLTIIIFVFISCMGTNNNNQNYKYGDIDSCVISGIANDTSIFRDSIKYIDIECSSEIIDNNIMIEDVQLISLETTQASFVGNIDKIIIRDSMIYLLDVNQTKSLKVFRLATGQFVCKIGGFGKSNTEYIEPTDFAVAGHRIFILDNISKKILEYDLENNFIRAIRLKYSIQSINTTNKDSVFICVAGDNRHLNTIDKYKILMIDSDGNIKSKYFKSDFDLNYFELNNLKIFNDDSWYHSSFSNEIGCIKNSTSMIRYKFRFNKKRLPDDFAKICDGDFGNFIDNYRNKNSYLSGACYYTDRYLFSQYVNQGRSGSMFIYDKVKNEIVYNGIPAYNSKNGRLEDFMMMKLGSTPLFVSNDNYVYGAISSESASTFNHKDLIKKKIKKDTITATDNPILFKIKFI